jgi:hypothetical protein
MAVIAQREIAELQLRVHGDLSAQNTAAHSSAIRPAETKSRSTTDSRRIEGETEAGGCE